MNEVIKSGVKTKILLLSATPVNNDLKDLRNQLYFITEDNDQAFAELDRYSQPEGDANSGSKDFYGMGAETKF